MTFRDCTGKHQILSSAHLVEKVGKRALGFEYQDGAFVGNVWTRFLPKGLIIWGAPDGSTLSQALITNANYGLASHAGVPTKFFGHWKSYAEIAKSVDEGLEPPGWCTWSSVLPGQMVRIVISAVDGRALGPKDGVEICMWGVSAEY